MAFNDGARLRTDRERTWRHFKQNYGEAIANLAFILSIAALVAFFVSVLVFSSNQNAMDVRADHKHQLMVLINGTTGDARTALAEQLIYIEEHGGVTDISADKADAAEVASVAKALHAVAQSREPLSLPTPRLTWSEYWHGWFPLIVAGYVALLLLGSFVIYAWESADRYYLLDLRWKSVWPVILVGLTFLPVGWLFYLPSFFRLRSVRKRYAAVLTERQELVRIVADETIPVDEQWQPADRLMGINDELGFPTGEDLEDYNDRQRRFDYGRVQIRFRDDEYRQPATTEFHSSPHAARQQYAAMRTQAGTSDLKRRRRYQKDQLSDVETDLRQYGEAVKEAQASRRGIRAEVARLDDLLAQQIANPPDPAQLSAEFDRLLALRGVKGARVVNDKLCLLVEARIQYNGATYDLGDWELQFGVGTNLTARELRSGVRSSWRAQQRYHNAYPAYRLGNGEFCFGNRVSVIEDNLMKGQFLEAVEVAVNSVCSVNEADRPKIPQAFYKIKQEEATP